MWSIVHNVRELLLQLQIVQNEAVAVRADESQLLGADPGADLKVPTADEERIQGAVRFVELRAISKVVADYQHLIQLLHLQLLGRLSDLALPLDDAPQRRLVPLVVVGLFPLGINTQVLLYVLLYRDPAVVDIDGRAKYVDFLEDTRYCSTIMLISATVLPDLLGPRKIPVHGTKNTTSPKAVCCCIQP